MRLTSLFIGLMFASVALANSPSGKWTEVGIVHLDVCKLLNPSDPCPWTGAALSRQVEFGQSIYSLVESEYADQWKTSVTWQKKTLGAFDVFDSTLPNTVNLDIRYSSVALTPMDAKRVILWNKIKFCGIEDWQVNVERDVTGVICHKSIIKKRGEALYSIIQTDGAQLYFGDISDVLNGTTPDLRPNQVDRASTFIQE